MSLRLRLFLAFFTVAAVMAGVGGFSFYVSHRVEKRAADVTRVSIAEFERGRSLGDALEIEGEWEGDAGFIANEVTRLGGRRRPKLRGAIVRIDPVAHTIWMYRVAIAVDEETEFLGSGGVSRFDSLSADMRAEVSCSVDNGNRLRARKIRTGDIKSSDKIKGTVTDISMDGVSPDSVVIAGIMIVVGSEDARDPRAELRRISLATRMNRAVYECVMAADAVLSGRTVATGEGGDEREDARTVLLDGAVDLEYYVKQARAFAEETSAGTILDQPLGGGLWLAPLAEKTTLLAQQSNRFLGLADEDHDLARRFLMEELEPLLTGEILPLIEAYRQDAEESLALDVASISAQARTMSRALIVTSAGAFVIALVLGFLVWRSISRPLVILKDAAEQIGRGRLETRVAVTSRDELGILSDTINHMAEHLSMTTVSIANMNNIIDSMSGALFVLDDTARIASVNRAAAEMLGYSDGSLDGEPFASICMDSGVDDGFPTRMGSDLAVRELTFRRRDGSSVPVSFSGSALRRREGPIQGFVCVAQDLTERKTMEEQLRRSLAEKDLLLREVHHRVKNNLQVISSLLDLQASYAGNDFPPDMFADSQNRIRSMALIHEQLYRATDLDKIDFAAYLGLLTDSLFHSYLGSNGSISLEMNVEPCRLDIDQALACGLIINELVTNSVKHAFPVGRGGTITVSFAIRNGQRELRVSDDGQGLQAESHESSDTLGMNLVSALVGQLGGELTVTAADGTEFRIDFPAATGDSEATAP